MSKEYYYLVSSLPMLEFGMKMPLSYDDFLKLCEEQLSAQDLDIIKRAKTGPFEGIRDNHPALREWKIFDTVLRNEIAKIRAMRKSRDPLRYTRGEDYTDPFIEGFAQWIISQTSPLEAEISLDRARWERIEELQRGHYFDIDYLITYALKLQILERWARINSEEGMKVLQELVEKEIA